MRLPIIKQLVEFADSRDADYLHETIEVLEALTEVETLKDQELDVLGEMMSNIFGAIEVQQIIAGGKSQKEALNLFMQRVVGSIDKT